jgi:tRNA-2-methylthio-N6-dimethylallyladenosine synthase
MLHYYIWTIGCQMNKSESERLAAFLEYQGYLKAEKVEVADIIILNSCVVRQSAEDRVINKLHSLKTLKSRNSQMKIMVTGCIVDEQSHLLRKKFPFVDYFVKAGDFPDWLGQYNQEKTLPKNPGIATYIPIMQGCNNFCAYCIVPYRRGREKSRSIAEILFETRNLISKGVKEITLLGQNVNSFGQDLAAKPDLADLLGEMNGLEGLVRIRFLTNHPKDMPIKLLLAMHDLEKVCEQINLPCQSGDDVILSAMQRGYTVDHYRRLIGEIRHYLPEAALSTDVIVGFPGETDAQFSNTLNLLKEIRFDMVHVAAYSPRSGTLAARTMPDDVPLSTKKDRLAAIEKQQAQIVGEINAGLIGQTVEILVEGQDKGKWFGRTRGDKLVFFTSDRDCLSQIVRIKVDRSSPWSLIGTIEQFEVNHIVL